MRDASCGTDGPRSGCCGPILRAPRGDLTARYGSCLAGRGAILPASLHVEHPLLGAPAMVEASTSEQVIADPRYRKVRDRDAPADGTFVYAVATTGVFCRPSCSSRPARPENIAFFDTGADAAAAGYRPCLRCRPLDLEEPDRQSGRMQELAAFIAAHADETLPLKTLAARTGMSPFHLQRTFKAVLGVSPKDFQAAERLKAFKSNLRQGERVLDATFGAGYGSTSRVYEQIDGGLGMTPSAYRSGGAGETI